MEHEKQTEGIIGAAMTALNMLRYLNITGLRVALLLNFKYSDLRWRGLVR